jgi:predicted DNA-binding transcriptional regulator AlpA
VINIRDIKMITTDDYGQERLINVNEIAKILGVGRTYFSQKIVPHTNFLEIAPPIRLYGNGASKYQLKDVLKFIESRREQAIQTV